MAMNLVETNWVTSTIDPGKYNTRNYYFTASGTIRGHFFVCHAYYLPIGLKSRMRSVDGEALADRKGVHREVGSEGSVRQSGDVTNRKVIQGLPSGLLSHRSRCPKVNRNDGW